MCLLLTAGMLLLAGCATVQDSHYLCATQARCEYACLHASKNPLLMVWPSDFSRGWKAGYYCVLTGGSGQAPCAPPITYWAPGRQNPRGRAAVEEWYQGFQAGSRLAAEENAGQFHYIRPVVPASLAEAPIPPNQPPAAQQLEPLPQVDARRPTLPSGSRWQ